MWQQNALYSLRRCVSPLWPDYLTATLGGLHPPWENVVDVGVPIPWSPSAAPAAICSVVLPEVSQVPLDGWGCGRVGEAAGVPMALFLLVKMTSRPQLPPLCISTCHWARPQYASATQAQFSRGQTPCSVADICFCSFRWDSLLALGGWEEEASLPDSAF